MDISINEINIVCTDGESSLHFYRDILGFTVVSEEENCWHLMCGNTAFLLMPFATERLSKHEYCTVPTISVDLVVENLEETKQSLETSGVSILESPAPNSNRFFIEDPDGLVFEVISKYRVGT